MSDINDPRAELMTWLLRGVDGLDAADAIHALDAYRDAYRDELLREGTALQRRALIDYQSFREGAVPWPAELAEWVIDPIDPDKVV